MIRACRPHSEGWSRLGTTAYSSNGSPISSRGFIETVPSAATREGLAKYLDTNLAIKTEVFDPFALVSISPEDHENLENKCLYTQAMALAQIGSND